MRIAFDAKRIARNATGLGNYGRFVVNALADHFPQEEFRLYSPDQPKAFLEGELPSQSCVSYHYPNRNVNAIGKALWRSVGIVKTLKRDEVDLFHGLSNELPMGFNRFGIPSVVTIHDLIFLRYPQFYKKIDREIYRYKFRKACQAADRIIAVSETTKKEVIQEYHISSEKITVVYQGCHSLFTERVPAAKCETIRDKFTLPSAYLLSVGTIEERKNLFLTVKALKISGLDIKLVVIGKQTPYAEQVKAYIRDNGMEEQVRFLKNVGTDELPAIYQMASLFVYPSLFEGFGIPILEALNSSIPVIAATGSCLEEAGGPASIYVDPRDANELAEKMKWVLTNPRQAGLMQKAGLEYARRFAPDQIAEDLMKIYRALL